MSREHAVQAVTEMREAIEESMALERLAKAFCETQSCRDLILALLSGDLIAFEVDEDPVELDVVHIANLAVPREYRVLEEPK